MYYNSRVLSHINLHLNKFIVQETLLWLVLQFSEFFVRKRLEWNVDVDAFHPP